MCTYFIKWADPCERGRCLHVKGWAGERDATTTYVEGTCPDCAEAAAATAARDAAWFAEAPLDHFAAFDLEGDETIAPSGPARDGTGVVGAHDEAVRAATQR